MTTENGKAGSTKRKRPKDIDSLTIRSWPKVIFLYPVVVTCLACGFVQWIYSEPGVPYQSETAGMVFFAVLCLNILVISFEFSRFKTMAVFFFILALLFFLLYLSTKYEVFTFLKDIFAEFHIKVSSSLYFGIAIYLLLIFVMVFINTRFNYWIIRSNEILHKEGFLGDVRRFPSPNLKMTKEIPDVFEFMLLGAGRVVLNPASERQSVVLEHVLRVNRVETAVQHLLSTLQVEVERGPDYDHDEGNPSEGTAY